MFLVINIADIDDLRNCSTKYEVKDYLCELQDLGIDLENNIEVYQYFSMENGLDFLEN